MELEIAERQNAISPFYRPSPGRDQYAGHVFKAITRGVSRNLSACELTYRTREEIDHEKAAAQLERYCQLLRRWDVDLLTIPGSDSYPDCCFVQDTAIVL
ncbi:MAG: hypothetical protein ABR555_19330, partial [Pyrinomonadaceae bacterium]